MTSDSIKELPFPSDSEPQQTLEAFQELASDSELVAIFVKTRNRDAAEQIVRRHGPMVAGVIRRMLSQSNDAEDAFQATFLVFFQSAHRIRKQASLSAWLYGVAYRTAYRVRKRAKQRSTTTIHEASIDPQENIDPLEKIVRESQLEQLDRELHQLQGNLKEIIVEHHLLGFSAPQIAERLNLSVSAIEGRLRRARSYLRERLARRGISFSVALALAAAYQNQTVAAVSQLWTSHFLESDFFSHTFVSKTLPSSNASLHSLIQGELAMKSLVVKSGGVAACLAAALCAIPYISSSSGESISPSMVMTYATETETSTSKSPSFESSSNPSSAVSNISNIHSPDNSALANLAENSQQNPLTTNNASEGELLVRGPFKITPFTKPAGPLPNWMVDGGTLAQEQDAAREQIRTLLRNKVKSEFKNTRLHDVLRSLAADAQVPIIIDYDVVDGSGISLDDPISLTLGEISLQRALQIILDSKELCYTVEPEHIQITTKDDGSTNFLRTYDLAYLLPSNERIEELIVLIQSTTRARWDVDGGEDSLQQFGSMLVAHCPEEVHLKIEGLLFEISKMNKDNLK